MHSKGTVGYARVGLLKTITAAYWWLIVNERGIMGVVVFTSSTADGKQSDRNRAEIMFMDEVMCY